ncbi:MAG: ABC transporter permease [Eubacteriales bacterium]|nr:ABC transporter permease [Eubacteriales bacterium]
MLVFNTFFRLLKRLKGQIIVYGVVFLSLALAMTKVLTTDNSTKDFQENSMELAVINRSQGVFGEAVKEYFGTTNEIIDVVDDESAIEDMLYWRELDYALIIPEDFEDSIKDGKITKDLQCLEVPGNFESSVFKAELEMYISKMSGLMAGGMSIEDATKELEKLKSEQVTVEVASFVNEQQGDVISNFFSYAPYLFLSLGIVVISSVLIFFNEIEVKKRMECSSMPLFKRQVSLFGAIVAFGMLLLAVVLVLAAVMSKGSMFTDVRMPYFLLNLTTMLLFSVSLAFLAGTLFDKTESVNGFVNIVSLALCFLGGIFVPQEFFSEGVQSAARFMPTYWYTKSNVSISAMATVTDAFRKEIFMQNLFVFSSAIAVFAISIVIVNLKRRRIAA